MDKELLNEMVCPICKGNLSLKIYSKREDVIEEGLINCKACKRAYSVKDGIPIMVEDIKKYSKYGNWDEIWEKTKTDVERIKKLTNEKKSLNYYALANMIKKACTEKDLREHLKRNARKSVDRFEKNKIDRLEIDYYKKELEMSRAGVFSAPFWRRIF